LACTGRSRSSFAQARKSGFNRSIGVITAAIEFGMVDAVEPVTTVVLDTPAGLVTGYAQVQHGSLESGAGE